LAVTFVVPPPWVTANTALVALTLEAGHLA